MPKFLRGISALLATTALVLTGAALVSPAEATALPRILAEGTTLRAASAHDRLVSAGGRFALIVYSNMIEIDQTESLDGKAGLLSGDTWSRGDATGHIIGGHDASTLRLQTDGNLVLRTRSGHRLWSTGTGGSGAHNALVLTSTGNLILYNTRTNRHLWASHTGARLLGSRNRLTGGKQLIMQPGQGEARPIVTTLSMQRNGRLVYRCNARVAWQTRSAVPGSYFTVSTNGKAELVSPHGTVLWASKGSSRTPYVWFDLTMAAVFTQAGRYVGSLPVSCGD